MPQEKLFNKNYLLLCLGNLLATLSFFMQMPVLPLYLTADLGASKTTAGLIVASYAIAALLFRPLSGCIVDRFPRKPTLMLFVLLAMVAGAGYIFILNLWVFALVRFMHGACFSVAGTSVSTLMVDNVPPAKLGTAIGFFGVLISLAMAVAPFVGLVLMNAHSAIAVFVAATLLAAGAALANALTGVPRDDRPAPEGPWLNAEHLFFRRGLVPALCSLLMIVPYGMITNYVSLLARERGLESQSGLFFVCLAAGTMLSRIYSGWLLDKGHVREVLLGGKLIALAALLVFVFQRESTAFLSTGLVMGLGFGMLMPGYQTLIISMADHDQLGTANSTYFLSMDAGIGLAILAGGFWADIFGLESSFLVGAASLVASLALFFAALAMRERHKRGGQTGKTA